MKKVKIYRNKASVLMEYVPVLFLIETNPGYWIIDRIGSVQGYMSEREFDKNQEHWELVDNELVIEELMNRFDILNPKAHKKIKVYRNYKDARFSGWYIVEVDGKYDVINSANEIVLQGDSFPPTKSFELELEEPCTNCHKYPQSKPDKHTLCYICSKMLIPDLPLDPIIQESIDKRNNETKKYKITRVEQFKTTTSYDYIVESNDWEEALKKLESGAQYIEVQMTPDTSQTVTKEILKTTIIQVK